MDWKRQSKHFWWMMFELMNRYCRFPVSFSSTSSFSIQFSHSVMSDSLQPHGLRDSRLPCLSATPGACSNSGPSSRWWHPTVPSSVIYFSSCLQSFPSSGPFTVNQFLASGGQSIGASSALLKKLQGAKFYNQKAQSFFRSLRIPEP